MEFTIEPQDATGDVRLAFFLDPDGTLLELLSGPPRYHRTHADGACRCRRRASRRCSPTSRSPSSGLPQDGVIGELDVDDMLITFVDGPVPLELFSFPGDGELLPAPTATCGRCLGQPVLQRALDGSRRAR